MKKYKLEFQYIITPFKKHKEIKQQLLKLIYECPALPIRGEDEDIYRSDWNLSWDTKREYIDFFWSYMEADIRDILKELNHEQYEFGNCWFQQYRKNNEHKPHQHGQNASYAFVYFVELPQDGPKTTLIEPYTGKHIEVDVKEGDILVFPGITWHYSPKNNSKDIKTIVAFNIN